MIEFSYPTGHGARVLKASVPMEPARMRATMAQLD